jgi:GxxExxY protein
MQEPAPAKAGAGLSAAQQHRITVRYDDIIVGEYTADILVQDAVVVELKVVKALDSVHTAQCINYLKATDLRLCLLLNFGNPRVEIHRVVNGV